MKIYSSFIVHGIYLILMVFCSYVLTIYIFPFIYTLGYLPIETGGTVGVYVTIISLFCFFQAIFRGVLQLFFPAPLFMTTFVDMFSFVPCIFLLADMYDYLPRMPFIPERFTPFIYFAGFIGLHLIFKLITLFASLFCKASSRRYSVGWFLLAFVFVYTAVLGLTQWKKEVILQRFLQVKAQTIHVANGDYVSASVVPEGSFYMSSIPLSGREKCMWFVRGDSRFTTATVFLYILFSDTAIPPAIIPLQISGNEWEELCLNDYMPAEKTNFTMVWSSYRLPIFIVRHGLVPQFSIKSLEEVRNFLFSKGEVGGPTYKSIYIDGPYCEKEVSGMVVIQ